MKHSLPVIAMLSCMGLAAQPVLTAADMTPAVGASFTADVVNYTAPGPATADFVFTVTDDDTLWTGTSICVEPSSTPYASTFPNATFAYSAVGLNGMYTYQSVDASGLHALGSYGPNYYEIASNDALMLQLPCSMGTTWTDSFSTSGVSQGTLSMIGTVTGEYNGYGTLILPFATFTNVARVEVVKSYTLSFSWSDFIKHVEIVSYYVQGFSQPLFQSMKDSTYAPGSSASVMYNSIMIDPATAAPLGISEPKGDGPSALVFPNPASDAFTISFTAPVPKGAIISLIDAVGKEVKKLEPTNAVANASTMSFDVSSVPRGMYIVRITDAQGRSSNMPLVLH